MQRKVTFRQILFVTLLALFGMLSTATVTALSGASDVSGQSPASHDAPDFPSLLDANLPSAPLTTTTPTKEIHYHLPVVSVGETATPTFTPTYTPTHTPTLTSTTGPSATPSHTPTTTDTPPPTSTFTATPTHTATPTQTATPLATPSFGISLAEATDLYWRLYKPALTEPHGFTGKVSTCDAGTISTGRLQAYEKQLNYFRTMAGVGTIELDDEMNRLSQEAALIMAANWELNHYPPADWLCYSADGYLGASRSNLGLRWGSSEYTDGIAGFIEDDGPYNISVGHRHWILYPPSILMGMGEVHREAEGGYVRHATANLVVGEEKPDGWQTMREEWLAWPPPGYVPYQVAYPRWSLHAESPAALVTASVQMWLDGEPVAAKIIYRGTSWPFTLVWEPDFDLFALDWGSQHFVRVEIRDLIAEPGVQEEYAYEILLFDPE